MWRGLAEDLTPPEFCVMSSFMCSVSCGPLGPCSMRTSQLQRGILFMSSVWEGLSALRQHVAGSAMKPGQSRSEARQEHSSPATCHGCKSFSFQRKEVVFVVRYKPSGSSAPLGASERELSRSRFQVHAETSRTTSTTSFGKCQIQLI